MKSNLETIEKYRQMLVRDPASKVFAALAESFREMGLLDEAEQTAKTGIERHPDYVGGYLALGRVLLDQEDYLSAVPLLKKATELDAQNLLAHQLLAAAYIQLKQPKLALRSFKFVLFLNPTSEKAKSSIEKLESLTADEYEDDVFTMQPLHEQKAPESTDREHPEPEYFAEAIVDPGEIDRSLSLVDALIVRNDLQQAKKALNELQKRFPEDSRYVSRWSLLNVPSSIDDAVPIKPILSREKTIIQRKIGLLRRLLHKINSVDQT